jgi:large subunit ribosomal protein L5e
MDKFYAGKESIDGEKFDVSENPHDERRPFMAVLDVGLRRTTTGARVFGALKGAVDAGLYIPHSVKRFPGYTKAEEDD